jgi:hypothetical protein
MSTASDPPNGVRLAAHGEVISELWGRQAQTMSESSAWKFAYWQ